MMNIDNHDYRITQDGFQKTMELPLRRPRRWLVFLAIFVPCMLASQTYIFLQPAIYLSLATVLTVAPTDIDRASTTADAQHVNIQTQILLGTQILEATASRLSRTQADYTALSVDQLRSLFNVQPVADTNLVQLQAEGEYPHFLQSAVNAWIDCYLQTRANFIAESTEKLTAVINGELLRIERQVNEKRNQIDQFRQEHSIVSTESADNQAHARLQGLNRSLNSALEDEVKARAKLDAIRDAVSRGKTVVPEADSHTMAALVQQAEKLRERLAELRAQYTDEYIELNPNLRRVQEQLREIESRINEKVRDGRGYAEQEAENNYAASRQAVFAIKQQMEEHKKQAADYTTQFAKHQALQQELLKLETLQQETKQRLVEVDVKQRQQYPQVDVVDWASLPDKPIRPIYWQESTLAFGASLLLGLLAVFIVDYLNREPEKNSPINLASIHLHQEPRAMLEVTPRKPTSLQHEPLPALPLENTPRELTGAETAALFQAAEASTQLIIALLLNGLAVSEIPTLTPDNIDFQGRHIVLGQRQLPMSSRTAPLLADNKLNFDWPSGEEIDALLCCAAIDSGLALPEQINADCLRHTYLLFLVRQGIKLAELAKIVGAMPTQQLLQLSRFSPAQTGLTLDRINPDYFQPL